MSLGYLTVPSNLHEFSELVGGVIHNAVRPHESGRERPIYKVHDGKKLTLDADQ